MTPSDANSERDQIELAIAGYTALTSNLDPEQAIRAGLPIQDEALRRSFLENVPWNRELVKLWEEQKDK